LKAADFLSFLLAQVLSLYKFFLCYRATLAVMYIVCFDDKTIPSICLQLDLL